MVESALDKPGADGYFVIEHIDLTQMNEQRMRRRVDDQDLCTQVSTHIVLRREDGSRIVDRNNGLHH